MAMNCASKASAISRASVVLPVPGGPQRIIECGRPEAKAAESGLPSPSNCGWPITSSSERGRSRSARGASAPPARAAAGSSGRLIEGMASAASSPRFYCAITSTPAGGTKRNRSAGKAGLASTCENASSER